MNQEWPLQYWSVGDTQILKRAVPSNAAKILREKTNIQRSTKGTQPMSLQI